MKTAIVAFEGVCVPDSTGKTLFESEPVPGALLLLTVLSKGYNLIVHCASAMGTHQDVQLLRDWLRLQNFPDVELLFLRGIDNVVQVVRRRGYDVSLVLDASPANVATCARIGVQALLVVSPSYMRPEFRPDYDGEIRPWDQMIEEIDSVRAERSKDARFEIVEPYLEEDGEMYSGMDFSDGITGSQQVAMLISVTDAIRYDQVKRWHQRRGTD